MTFDEAEAHLGNPVIAHEPGTFQITDGQIIDVDEQRRMVKLRVRRRTMPYDYLPCPQWWAPCHLSVPAWWTDKQNQPRT